MSLQKRDCGPAKPGSVDFMPPAAVSICRRVREVRIIEGNAANVESGVNEALLEGWELDGQIMPQRPTPRGVQRYSAVLMRWRALEADE